MPTEKEFQVLHVSSHRGRSQYPGDPGDEVDTAYDYRWFRYNLVFRAITPEFRDRCLDESLEHRKTRIYTDPDLHSKYIHNLRAINTATGKFLFENTDDNEEYKGGISIDIVNTYGIKSEDVYTTGYETVFNPVLIHIEKFDVFRFWGYFMDCPATEGICSTIYNLSRGINGCRVTDSHMFLTCLKTLDYFWD